MKKSSEIKDILISVIGLTPQVITETLYYLTQVKRPPIFFSEIYVITTASGKEKILWNLLADGKGRFFQFCDEYGFDPKTIKFDKESIFVIKDRSGNELKDVRTSEDNEAVADQIVNFIREKTAEPNTRLHCSLAGGRKTMGAYLALALQLFGRENDTLSHVLVGEELENQPDFYYKPRHDPILTVRSKDGETRQLNTRDIPVELAEIPYVRLRSRLEGLFGDKAQGYSELVKIAQQELNLMQIAPALRVSMTERKIMVSEFELRLQPMQFVIYCHLLKARAQHRRHKVRPGEAACRRCFYEISEIISQQRKPEILRNYKRFYHENSEFYKRLSDRYDQLFTKESLRANISKINRALEKKLPRSFYEQVKISAHGDYGGKAYGIDLDPSKIVLTE